MLTKADSNKWIVNTLIFIRPVILIYLGYVSANIGIHNGFYLVDLIPNEFVAGGMVLYLVNIATDYLRKLDAQTEIRLQEPLVGGTEIL